MFDHVDIRVDARVTSFLGIMCLPTQAILPFLYPRLFSIHDMSTEVLMILQMLLFAIVQFGGC